MMIIKKFRIVVLLISFHAGFITSAQSQGKETKLVSSQAVFNTIENQVDSIMKMAIQKEAFPGAQLMVLLKGEKIFHKTYGFHTYDSLRLVEPNALYDLASVTKIAGPLLALMKLYEEGKIDLDVPFSNYWKSWKNKKDKKNISLRELLAHQSGMQAYIVFLYEAMKKGKFKRRFLRTKSQNRFSKQAYDRIYVKDRFNRKMYRKIKRSPLNPEKKYLYSGLASLIYPKLIEQLSGEDYETYLSRNFYSPLGCETLGYNPMEKGLGPIIPTEKDTIFRQTVTKGWVHDENAALMGGVSGNAGLFGSASDLAILMQMLVQKGEYDGKRYLKVSTIEEFTRIQFPENENRRGLGFDKPLIGNDTLSLKESYPAPEVSASSFGHSGFTGTFVWADPEKELVFVFLSNRVYPHRSHRNLYELNVRPALQHVFYKGLFEQDHFTNN
ncbi:MAG: serine hydrolase [Flavobacteriaceae bacterium]|nr:serine hydrolase [Flavobacteriaceae bacterium]